MSDVRSFRENSSTRSMSAESSAQARLSVLLFADYHIQAFVSTRFF